MYAGFRGQRSLVVLGGLMNGRLVGKALLVGLGFLGVPGTYAAGTSAAAGPGGVLYFFTTPEAEGGPEGARRAVAFAKKYADRVTLRPVLLVHDWSGLKNL